MKIVLAIDKFKGSATSVQIANAAKQVIEEFDNSIEIKTIPVADGGDGTVDAMLSALPGAEIVETAVSAPVASLPHIVARYAIVGGDTAVMEVAAASGLALVPCHLQNVMQATSAGCGQMIADAYGRGVRHIVLGLGGSATCDGAMGLLDAIGFVFTGADGVRLTPCGENLGLIRDIKQTALAQKIATGVQFTLLSDVTCPLLGTNGAARVFAPQKGASAVEVELLEAGMANFAKFMPHRATVMPGAGAAGGIGAGMAAFLGAAIKPGVEEILKLAHFDSKLRGASLIITGEGRIDAQTAMGKAPEVIAQHGRACGIPVIAICGQLAIDAEKLSCFDQIIPITPPGMPLATAMKPDVTLQNIRTAIRTLLPTITKL